MFHSPEEEIAAELRDELGEMKLALAGKRLPAVPTRKEVFSLLRSASEPRDHLIMRLLYATGMRVSEEEALLYADVFGTERKILIRSGKEDRDRYVTADPITFELLAAHQGNDPPDQSVFGISVREIERIVHSYGEQVGLVERYRAVDRTFSPHSLRHAMATHCYEGGMDLFALKVLLGHQFLETTELYVHTAMEHARREYRKAHPLGKSH